MQTRTIWKEKMAFSGEAHNQSVPLDSKPPLGKANGFTPKELVSLAIAGCTAMDVVALLKKFKQPVDSFEVISDVEVTEGVHPAVFKHVSLTFNLTGAIDKSHATKAVELSQTRYCGVSAMISKVAPISYRIILNGEEIGTGQATF